MKTLSDKDLEKCKQICEGLEKLIDDGWDREGHSTVEQSDYDDNFVYFDIYYADGRSEENKVRMSDFESKSADDIVYAVY